MRATPHVHGCVAYTDALCASYCGDNIETIRADLSVTANNVLKFFSTNFLSLSPGKTQVMVSGLPQLSKDNKVFMCDTLSFGEDLLGVRFDKNFRLNPFNRLQQTASALILATVRRHYHYLPQAHLAQVASALLVGKLSYAAPASFMPRLTVDDPINSATQKLQVCINEAARAIIGVNKPDKINAETLLAKADLPTINQLVVKAIASKCW